MSEQDKGESAESLTSLTQVQAVSESEIAALERAMLSASSARYGTKPDSERAEELSSEKMFSNLPRLDDTLKKAYIINEGDFVRIVINYQPILFVWQPRYLTIVRLLTRDSAMPKPDVSTT